MPPGGGGHRGEHGVGAVDRLRVGLDDVDLDRRCLGTPHDLTIRSFGVLRAAETPPIEVDIVESDAHPVNGSDAVFAAVAAAAWRHAGFPPLWPCAR